MKQEHEEGKKIPFLFTPIPNFLFESDYFRDAEYFRFLCYAFSRTTFERKIAVFNGQKLELNSLEFVFGRNKWAEYLEIDSTLVRKYIYQLTRQQIHQQIICL